MQLIYSHPPHLSQQLSISEALRMTSHKALTFILELQWIILIQTQYLDAT